MCELLGVSKSAYYSFKSRIEESWVYFGHIRGGTEVEG